MKFITSTALLVLLLFAPAWGQSGKPSSLAELASYTGSDRERLLLEGAKREGKVVWYTTLAAEQNKQIASAFETRYAGVKVETFRTGSSALAQRLLNEATARRHIADAIETTLPGLLTFRDNQLLMPYTSPHLAAFPEDSKEKASEKSRLLDDCPRILYRLRLQQEFPGCRRRAEKFRRYGAALAAG